jgi:hypothetical protein
MGPGGSGLPGALGAWALSRVMDVNTTIVSRSLENKQNSNVLTATPFRFTHEKLEIS